MPKTSLALPLLAALAAPCAADPSLVGAWLGEDRAAESIYETLTITANRIAWGSPGNPNGGRCETGWHRVLTGRGEADYPGNLQGPRDGRGFEVVVLGLAPADCARGARYLLFALPDDVPDHAEVASFDEHWTQTGWHNFSRVPPAR
jgi:hypothetical protein